MTSPFTFFDLRTLDIGAARRFYADLLGWTSAELDVGPTPIPFFVDADGPWAGFTELAPDDERRPQWIPYVTVASVAHSLALACDLGATVIKDVTDIGVGLLAVVNDPSGATFVLWQDVPGPA